MEQPKRTLIKTLTWRLIALVTTIIVVYIYSGDVKESFTVGLVANGIKMFLYYMHERIWNKVKFGRIQSSDYQI